MEQPVHSRKAVERANADIDGGGHRPRLCTFLLQRSSILQEKVGLMIEQTRDFLIERSYMSMSRFSEEHGRVGSHCWIGVCID